ncbi:MAG: GTP cyclohydrolase I [Myxococcota bacterium]|jgi:GTP cyclohydrolase I|nr:GTP cyclohydrolase I [Myxococcota bacterium]
MTTVDLEAAQQHYFAMLQALGSHASPAEAQEAARLATSLLASWTSAAQSSTLPKVTPFAAPEQAEWIALRKLSFYALCEHHMVPFFGSVDVVYLPRRSILGFGSVLRVLDHLCRRPQLQEKLAQQLASAIEEVIDPEGILIRVKARQLCVEMRGHGAGSFFVCMASRGCAHEETARAVAISLLEAETT